MPHNPNPVEPPGEDALGLAESLGWLVATCTRARDAARALGDALRRARHPGRVCGA